MGTTTILSKFLTLLVTVGLCSFVGPSLGQVISGQPLISPQDGGVLQYDMMRSFRPNSSPQVSGPLRNIKLFVASDKTHYIIVQSETSLIVLRYSSTAL